MKIIHKLKLTPNIIKYIQLFLKDAEEPRFEFIDTGTTSFKFWASLRLTSPDDFEDINAFENKKQTAQLVQIYKTYRTQHLWAEAFNGCVI